MTHRCFVAVQAKIKMFFPLSIAIYDNIHISALDTWTDTSLSAVELSASITCTLWPMSAKLFPVYIYIIICCYRRDVGCSNMDISYLLPFLMWKCLASCLNMQKATKLNGQTAYYIWICCNTLYIWNKFMDFSISESADGAFVIRLVLCVNV